MSKIETIAPVGSLQAANIELKKVAAGSRLHFTKWGVKASLSDEQMAGVGGLFEADTSFIEARRCKIDTKHPAYRAVTKTFSQCKDYWKGLTLPYPEAGIRLIRQSFITSFNDTMGDFRTELQEHVVELDNVIPELKETAKKKAGKLYNDSDFPASFVPLFKIDWDFPTLEPPEYLKKLAPDIYEKEQARLSARIDEAVQLAEQGFITEFHKAVAHLTNVISGSTDGKKKIFKDSAVDNLKEFFDKFKLLSVRSNKDLDGLVEKAQALCDGVTADGLRTNADLKSALAQQMSGLSRELEGMLVARPARAVKKGGAKDTNGKSEQAE